MLVNQAASMLDHTLIDLLSDMLSRARVAAWLAGGITLTNDIVVFSVAFY